MTFASEPVKSATYTADDGSRCFALIVEDNGDKVNLAYLDPAVYTWHAANDVPKDSNRLK
jgi:hypothetical protein